MIFFPRQFQVKVVSYIVENVAISLSQVIDGMYFLKILDNDIHLYRYIPIKKCN